MLIQVVVNLRKLSLKLDLGACMFRSMQSENKQHLEGRVLHTVTGYLI